LSSLKSIKEDKKSNAAKTTAFETTSATKERMAKTLAKSQARPIGVFAMLVFWG